MDTKEPFSFRFRYSDDPDYIKEQEELKKDTSWHKCHDFVRSYFWWRHSDNSKVYCGQLHKRDIPYLDFPKLPPEEIERIVVEIKEEERKHAEYLKANPIVIGSFDKIHLPNISKTFPKLIINDLVGVQPIK